jgi:yecA family protein
MAHKSRVLRELGEPSQSTAWPDYLAYGFSEDDVPDLIELVRDDALNEADADSDEVWAPLHAWRTLGQLASPQAVRPLIDVFARLHDDDWALTELPLVLAKIGEPSIEPLRDYLNDPADPEFARVMAAEGLKHLAEIDPTRRPHMVAILTEYLTQPDPEARYLNASVVGCLIDLGAVESIDAIRAIYQRGLADIGHAGDIEDVEIELGLRIERSTPKPNYFPELLKSFQPPEPEDGIYGLINGLLEEYGSDESILDASELDGFLCAVACAPVLIKPSRWLPAIWGGPDRSPAWPDLDEAQRFLSTVTLIYNDVVRGLADDSFEALYLERRIEDNTYTIVDEWCDGFLRGLRLWPRLEEPQQRWLDQQLAPIRLFAGEQGTERLAELDPRGIGLEQARIEPAVGDIYRHFAAAPSTVGTIRREGEKIGRNDPCPCGSGKKYKHCCLH